MQKVKYDTPFIFHYREGKEKGGLTVVFDPKTKLFGVSRCSSKDNYNKKLGYTIANGRIQKGKGKFVKSFVPRVAVEAGITEMFVEDIKRQANDVALQNGVPARYCARLCKKG